MIKAYITGMRQGQRFARETTLQADAEIRNKEMKLISVYPQVGYQTIRGFGGAFTDAAGYVYAQMDEASREEMIRTYFDPKEMGYTWGRTSIDSSDFGVEMYAADDDPRDTALERMDFTRNEKYVLPLLRDAGKAAGAPIRMMLTPWSPPAWMKTNGSRVQGGSLREECAPIWAEYICRYALHCIETGVDVRLLSAQNEPHAIQRWDSCIFTDAQERDFIRDHLAPALKRHGLDKRLTLLIWDHNKEHVLERAQAILCDRELRDAVGGIAFHWYSGDHFENLSMAHALFPEQRLVFSEGCVEHSVWGSDAELPGAIHYAHEYIGDINAGADTLIEWNLVLDEKGGPNHVGNFCDAPMMYDTVKRQLHKKLSLQYIGHFSRHIRPGAVRIGVSRYTPSVEATAVKNADGTIAVVMLNPTREETAFNLQIGESFYPITLPAGAIITCVKAQK